MTQTAMTFPDFYCECAYNDGRCDARDGTNSRACYNFGDRPDALRFYEAGRAAVKKGGNA